MKKLLLPILLVLLALPVWAQASVLTFKAERGELFQVRLDGQTINHTPSTFVRLNNLRPGRHYLEFKVRSRHGVYNLGQRVLVRNGVESNYGVRTVGRSGKAYLRLLREVRVAPPVVVVPVPRYPDRYEDRRHDGRYEEPRHDDRNDRTPPRYEDYDDDACRNLLTAEEMDHLVQTMRSRDSESTKMSIAREAVRNGSIAAEDLKRVLQEFEFENARVEFAKYAYDYLCDREHFYYIYDAFSFDSSVEELERYSNGRR
ncbi:DUF4476 domain-containing protein [Pontibacter russatus]|uniref:DUF4476 domain-containing protein n=1 Tax=Pontibacter russatus TaxID=2694929 RepID=UPI00137A5351|nr:DUF4476 domain-containing protein [Pontibacter russatus]